MPLFEKYGTSSKQKKPKLENLATGIEGFTEEDIIQAFRHACWDLYVSNLPDPKIINNAEKGKEDDPRKHIPRGFAIDTKTWQIRFNVQDMPKKIEGESNLERYLSEYDKKSKGKEHKLLARSLFQHECGAHFTQVPSDAVTEAILIDSAIKGFTDPNIAKNKHLAADYSFLAMNIMGDLIGDTLLARKSYGRDDFSDLTVWRTKEFVREARNTPQKPSMIWQTLVSSYEKLWQEDLGLNNVVQKRNPVTEKAAEDLVKVLGNDYRNRDTWEDKVRKFAAILEPIIKQDVQDMQQQGGKSRYGNQKQSGNNLPIPDDVQTQMGNPTESKIGSGKGKYKKYRKGEGSGAKESKQSHDRNESQSEADQIADSIDERIIDEIYQRNKKSPGKFAGTMGALTKLEPDDLLRLMYRARARELLMSINELENQRAEKVPAYQTPWNIGDPIMGKGGLEIIPSVMSSGKPIPGITTFKRKMTSSNYKGKLKAIPDIFIAIDSSGSMSWSPMSDNPEQRGEYDKAILAAEAASLYSIKNGGKVAILNFSGESNVTEQYYTSDMNSIERAIMSYYGGGTVVPIDETYKLIKGTKNPLLTCLISDCMISNDNQATEVFHKAITEHDKLAVFLIHSDSSNLSNSVAGRGANIYKIKRIDDLIGLIIGEVRKEYEDVKENDAD